MEIAKLPKISFCFIKFNFSLFISGQVYNILINKSQSYIYIKTRTKITKREKKHWVTCASLFYQIRMSPLVRSMRCN